MVSREPLRNPARPIPPFVGRKEYVAQLNSSLHEAITGRPQVVLISGETGAGKTRLLKETSSIARQHGFQACFGRVDENAMPYSPFVEALRSLQALPAETLEVLEQLQTQIRSSPFPSPAIAADAQVDPARLQILLTVSQSIITLTQRAPLLLALDDLHRFDQASLYLLGHLVSTLSDTAYHQPVPFLLIGTYRPSDPATSSARTLARLQREEICLSLELSGLTVSEMRSLIQELGLRHPSNQLLTTLEEATQGNPFLLQQAFYYLVKQHALQERGGYVITTALPTEIPVSAHMIDPFLSPLQQLSPNCRQVLLQAAFLGESFSFQSLRAVSNMDEDTLLELLEEGVGHRLLFAQRTEFTFAHPTIRSFLLQELPSSKRQRIHLQIAQTLERFYADNLSAHSREITYHLVRAGPLAPGEHVVEYARQAGDRAFQEFDWSQAARYYENALSVLTTTGTFSLPDRAALHTRAALAYFRDVDVGPSLDHYEKAIKAYHQMQNQEGLLQALIEKTHTLIHLAPVPYGILFDLQPLEAMLISLGEKESVLRGRLLIEIAEACWHARQRDRALELAQQALTMAQSLQDTHLYALTNGVLGLIHWQRLQIQDALECWQNALFYTRRTADRWRQGELLNRIALVLTQLGRFVEAELVAREGWTVTQQTRNRREYGVSLAVLLSLEVTKGDFSRAQTYAQEIRQWAFCSPWGSIIAFPALAGMYAASGDWAQAKELLESLREPNGGLDKTVLLYQEDTAVYHHLVQMYAGRDAESREPYVADLLSSKEIDPCNISVFCALIELAQFRSAPDLAKSIYPVLFSLAEQGVLFSGGWMFLLPRLLGVAAALNRWWNKAEEHFQKAIQVATHLGARPELGRTYLDYACMLQAKQPTKDRQRALALSTQALTLFRELGMEPFVQQATWLVNSVQPQRMPAFQPQDYRGLSAQKPPQLKIGTVLNLEKRKDQLMLIPRGTEHGILVILVIQMEGAAMLIHRYGDIRAQELLQKFHALIRTCLQTCQGSEIKHTDDSMIASFFSASRAIACAVAIQQALTTREQDASLFPIPVRVGINAGEPIAEEGQLFGIAVNTAVRICAHAQPGQILVSDVVQQLAVGKGFVFIDRGQVSLKGLAEPFRLHEVRWTSQQQEKGESKPNAGAEDLREDTRSL